MGLDINVYRRLRKVDKPEVDEDGYPVEDDKYWRPGESMKWSESIWKGKGSPLEWDSFYTYDERFDFRAGSYSGYNLWRNLLDKFKGDIAFQELIDFADNEGVIGSVLSNKLRDDFYKYTDEAVTYAKTLGDYGDYFIENYNDFKKAFEMASDDGAVEFC